MCSQDNPYASPLESGPNNGRLFYLLVKILATICIVCGTVDAVALSIHGNLLGGGRTSVMEVFRDALEDFSRDMPNNNPLHMNKQ